MATKTGKLLEPTDLATGINSILPHRHKEVWDMFRAGVSNNWDPEKVNMARDKTQWEDPDGLTDDERLLVKRCMGFFAGGESLVGNNLFLAFYRWINDAECRQYMARQIFEESIHNWTMVSCVATFGWDEAEVMRAYETIPSIQKKTDFLMRITSDLARPDFNPYVNVDHRRELLRGLVTFFIVCEGILFFSGFAMLLSLGKQNKLQGLSEQIRYTVRDETIHVQYGSYLINTIKRQYPETWTEEFVNETISHIKEAVQLEIEYAHDVLPNGILGLNADMFVDYMYYIANIRLKGIGVDFRFPSVKNPFPWLSEIVETRAMTNFFERRPKEYQTSTNLEDDF